MHIKPFRDFEIFEITWKAGESLQNLDRSEEEF